MTKPQLTPRQVDFDQGRPLIISIHQHNNGIWTIHPTDASHSPSGPTHTQMMDHRIANDLPNIDAEWEGRRSFGATMVPEFRAHAHTPIVIRNGEHVEFKCALPFVVQVRRNPHCSPDPDDANNPFNWQLPQASAIVTVAGKDDEHVVKAQVISPAQGEPSPTLQRFYKCVAQVYDGSRRETIFVDPNVICDSF